MWKTIDTAPKDGTQVLLTGWKYEDINDPQKYSVKDLICKYVVGFWDGNNWVYSHWDGHWRSECSPTHWAEIKSFKEI